MKVVLSRVAEKQLKKLQKLSQIIVAKKIRNLRNNSSETSGEQLKGFRNVFRVRVGDLRIVYKKTKSEIYIVWLGHRKDIYKKLKKILD